MTCIIINTQALCMHIICLNKPTVSVGTFTCLFWCLIKSVSGGAVSFVALCFEIYANVNKNVLKKHTTSHWRLRYAVEGRKDEERGKSEITKQNEGGGYIELRHHLAEIMKRSKTCSHCHFHCLIYSLLRLPNNANEFWFLPMLTTGDNFGSVFKLRPNAWRMDRSFSFYWSPSQ